MMTMLHFINEDTNKEYIILLEGEYDDSEIEEWRRDGFKLEGRFDFDIDEPHVLPTERELSPN